MKRISPSHRWLMAATMIAAVTSVVAAGGQSRSALAVRVIEARISPDGQSVAYIRAPVDGAAGLRSLLRISYAGGAPTSLVSDCPVGQLRWSRDSLQIGFVIDGKPGQLMTVPAQGGTARAATAAEASSFVAPVSGKPSDAPPMLDATVLYVDAVGTGQQSITLTNGRETWIDLLTVKTGQRVNVMPPGIATILSAPSWSADGTRFVVIGENSEHGPEVFAGALPLPLPPRPDFVGAPPPQIRRLTFSNR